jgi:hypothetical protein
VLGTVAGHLPGHAHLALLYFDLHADLNVSGSVTSGSLDWMGTAHMIGAPRAANELRCFGSRHPLLAPEQLLLFSLGLAQSTPSERRVRPPTIELATIRRAISPGGPGGRSQSFRRGLARKPAVRSPAWSRTCSAAAVRRHDRPHRRERVRYV